MHYLGIDVAKAKLDSALSRDHKPESFLEKKVSNNTEGFTLLLTWSCQKAVCTAEQLHVLLEATGPYHEQVALFFCQQGCKVSVLNPARVKQFAQAEGLRAKQDRLDAKVLARFGLKMQPLLWTPPAPDYNQLRQLLLRLESLSEDWQRESNRLEKLDASATASALVRRSLERTLAFLEQEKQVLETQIQQHLEQHPQLKQDQQFLDSIPGVGAHTAAWMNALLQHASLFHSARQVAAFLGLTPTEHSSGSSVRHKPRLSKAGPSIYRKILYMPTMVAVRHNPDLKEFYQRLLKNGKSKMAALLAAMRKLVHICFGVIKHQMEFKSQLKTD